MVRFLRRVWQWVRAWNTAPRPHAPQPAGLRERALCIRQMEQDIEQLDFHTALSALMTWHNALQKLPFEQIARQTVEELLILLAPMAPFLAEELWHQLAHADSVHLQRWPAWEATDLESDVRVIVVQVNGRRRGLLELSAPTPQDQVVGQALELPKVAAALGGQPPARIVYVADRLLNLVTSDSAPL